MTCKSSVWEFQTWRFYSLLVRLNDWNYCKP